MTLLSIPVLFTVFKNSNMLRDVERKMITAYSYLKGFS